MKVRRIWALMLAAVLWMCSYMPVSAITPWYDNVTDSSVTLSYEGIVAKCKVSVTVMAPGTEVSGDLVLKNVDTGETAASWGLLGYGGLNESRSAVVLRGYTYELSFTGKAKKGSDVVNISRSKTLKCE